MTRPALHKFSLDRWLVAACAVVSCALTACTTDAVGLRYERSPGAAAAGATAPAVSVGSFTDQRGESAVWLGAIRGGYGQPLKTLDVSPSVAAVVQGAFADGLRARGFQGAGVHAYQIVGTIRKFDCSQYVRREAHAVIEIAVFNSATGKQVFSQTYSADSLDGSLLSLKTGYFASVDELRALAEKTLAEVVDKALDDSALRNAMRT